MADEKESCSILFITDDMEWHHAFSKGVQRFYLLNERKAETLETATTRLLESRPDLVILAAHDGLPTMEQLRPVVREKVKPPVPVIVIDDKPEGLDQWIKQGAEYACARRDLLSAVKHVQQIMRVNRYDSIVLDIEREAKATSDRYDRIYQDIPDPIAYVQDGLFFDANPAFLRVFGVKDRDALDELTLMSFVPHKSERGLKLLLKKAMEKEIVPSEKYELTTLAGGKLEMNVSVSSVMLNGERGLQMYFRSTDAGGSAGGGGVDPTTGLGGAAVLAASIKQSQERSEPKAVLGYWVYLWLENYREVWQKDGFKPAEIMIKEVVETAKRYLPSTTEMVRYTDDGIAMWMSGNKEEVIQRVNTLITRLDEVVPENVGRLIHPTTYAGMYEITTESQFDDLVSKGFRAVRSLAVSQSSDRVAEPMSGELSRKDERRINEIQAILDEGRVKVLYQPISALEADGVPRYADYLRVVKSETAEREEMEFDVMWQMAERFGFAHQFDRIKITTMLQDILTYNGDQKALNLFISVSVDTLNDETFPEWVDAQLKSTGVDASQTVFELRVDAVANAYSGVKRLIDYMRPKGSRFALADVGRLDSDIEEMLERVKPEVIKLDMREIDTFEDKEEEEFMSGIKKYAEEKNIMLIADHMDSPAQLSHVWPHDIHYIQGNGIIPPIEKFNFDFSDPLF